MKFLNWLNGKKTIFGLLANAALAEGLVDEGTTMFTILKIAAWTLTIIGAGHKIAKNK